MEIRKAHIDGGEGFDWGKTSEDYAKFRDIYPPAFYRTIAERGLCVKGQRVLDLGTGTGVLPRNMQQYGAEWVGTDISPEQIAQAKRLAEAAGYDIPFYASAAEELRFPAHSFDVVTACQCWWYFDYETLTPKLLELLKPDGSYLVLFMAWLPFESGIAAESERIVLKYHPAWNGGGYTRKPLEMPERLYRDFEAVWHGEYDMPVHFTRESWHGRMRACRGVGASLPPDALAAWDREHRDMLGRIAPPEFDILHHTAMLELKPKQK